MAVTYPTAVPVPDKTMIIMSNTKDMKQTLKNDESKMKKRYIIETECEDIIEMINVQVKCGRAKLISANRADMQ